MMLALYDPFFLLIIPGLLLGFYAQMKLGSTYRRFIQVPTSTGVSGAEAAREILDQAGLRGVAVHEVAGHLTDHYDPGKRALFLSSDNYHGRSLAAVGVAAHEAGHALQHRAQYAPLAIRMWLVPATNFASMAVYGIVLASLVFGLIPGLAKIAVGVFAVIALFQVVTLPVEFDASRRAKEQLLKLGLVTPPEQAGVGKVLSAAALTYVAAMVASLLELLRWVMLARASDRD